MSQTTAPTLAQQVAASILANIRVGNTFRTPDNASGSEYVVTQVMPDSVSITPGTKANTLSITKRQLEETYLFLLAHSVTASNPMVIGSNNRWEDASPLCRVARGGSNRQRIVNYILPILAHWNYVQIDGGRPNSVWIPNIG